MYSCLLVVQLIRHASFAHQVYIVAIQMSFGVDSFGNKELMCRAATLVEDDQRRSCVRI